MKNYGRRFLILGVVLAVLIFVVSLALFPEWRGQTRTVVTLAALAVPAAFGFLAAFRQAVEKPSVEPQPKGENVPNGQAALTNGDSVGGDQNQAVVNGGMSGGIMVVGPGTTIISPPDPQPKPTQPCSPAEQRNVYFGSLLERCLNLPLAMIDEQAVHQLRASLELNKIYTVLYTRTREEPRQKGQKPDEGSPRFLSALEMINRERHLVILGEPGSGKSTLLRFLTLCMAGSALERPDINLNLLQENPLIQEARENPEIELPEEQRPAEQTWKWGPRLPVLVVLRDLAAKSLPKDGTPAQAAHLWEFIAAELPEDACPFLEDIKAAFADPGGLLLLDGLDELPRPEVTRVQIQQLIADLRRRYPKTQIIVTTRTYAYQKPDWKLSNFSETELSPFNALQMSYFISRWYQYQSALKQSEVEVQDPAAQAGDLKQAIFTRHPKLQDLAQNPLLLTVIAILHAVDHGQLPEQRAELYRRVVNLLLNRWDKKSAVGPNESQEGPSSLIAWLKLGDNDRKKVLDALCKVAFEVHRDQESGANGTADISFARLSAALEDISATGLEENAFRGLLADYLSQRAGILIERSAGVFSFPHRTFQEYLAAQYLANQKSFPKNINDLIRGDPDRWREAALLAGVSAYLGHNPAIWNFAVCLCRPASPEARCEADDWAAAIAGRALLESQDWANPDYQEELKEVQQALLKVLSGSLPPRERAQAGNHLAGLGDPRFDPQLFHLPADDTAGFIRIPAGKFWMGSDPQMDKNAYKDEQPQHEVELGEYWLAMYPVTVSQFRAFTILTDYIPLDSDSLRGVDNHPVVWVSWEDALAYSQWLGEQLAAVGAARAAQASSPVVRDFWQGLADGRLKVGLPSEAEWEKAARGGLPEQRIYPYAGSFDPNKGNTDETGIGNTSPVGCFPGGVSPYGLYDLSGNVWEWTRSLWGKDLIEPEWKYPYDPRDLQREVLKAGREVLRVLRGGSWDDDERFARCSSRYGDSPDYRYNYYGFRVSVLPFPPSNPP